MKELKKNLKPLKLQQLTLKTTTNKMRMMKTKRTSRCLGIISLHLVAMTSTFSMKITMINRNLLFHHIYIKDQQKI
jgi:hypothetical protein